MLGGGRQFEGQRRVCVCCVGVLTIKGVFIAFVKVEPILPGDRGQRTAASPGTLEWVLLMNARNFPRPPLSPYLPRPSSTSGA